MSDFFVDNLNWGLIEGVMYSDILNPKDILGPHIIDGKLCIVSYFPDAISVEVLIVDKVTRDKEIIYKTYDMEKIDEDVFAIKTKYKTKKKYKLRVHYASLTVEKEDPYRFSYEIPNSKLEDFSKGIGYDIYKYMGSHETVIDGVCGRTFSVWAPYAQRVSVVGDFNSWDGRLHQMSMQGNSGVFTIFIPNIGVDEFYKYEIRSYHGATMLKSDPYGSYMERRPNTASITYNSEYKWTSERNIINYKNKPMNIFELHLGSFKKPNDGREFYNYRELAKLVVDYVKKMNYTHVEIMPIMEHPFDKSWGYQIIGYYAPTSRYGTPDDFKYFIDYLHKNDIGVILDWVPAHFPKDICGLAKFDGTCLYEHELPFRGEHPQWGTLIFDYSKPEVTSFLISNVFYWAKEFNIDGIRVDAVASMLYLDYGRQGSDWIPNKYGGNENLDSIEFLKHLNSIVHKKIKNFLIIAEESTAWPNITGDVKKDSLGFDMKWNMGWMNDIINYMKLDPIYRSKHQGELTFSFSYAYSENFILVLSHDEVVHLKKSMLYKMPGTLEEKFANLRLLYSFMMSHPGKKLLFMGQDIGEDEEWAEDKEVKWDLLNNKDNKKFNLFVKDLNKFYLESKALFELDFSPNGFEWINGSYENESLLFFIRKNKKNAKDDCLVIACNFTPIKRLEFKVGVPLSGEYEEVFNSDCKKYGGHGVVNKGVIKAKKEKWDYKSHCITIDVPPLGVAIFRKK